MDLLYNCIIVAHLRERSKNAFKWYSKTQRTAEDRKKQKKQKAAVV